MAAVRLDCVSERCAAALHIRELCKRNHGSSDDAKVMHAAAWLETWAHAQQVGVLCYRPGELTISPTVKATPSERATSTGPRPEMLSGL